MAEGAWPPSKRWVGICEDRIGKCRRDRALPDPCLSPKWALISGKVLLGRLVFLLLPPAIWGSCLGGRKEISLFLPP